MSDDIEFVDGLIVKAPHERAPEYVKAQISIKVPELGAWLREQYKAGKTEWINLDVKVAKSGKWYAAVNTYKKDDKPQNSGGSKQKERSYEDKDDLPF